MQRWTQEQHEITMPGEINADSVSDLSTNGNAISTWYVADKTEVNIQQAVAALVSGFRSLDEVKVVFLSDEELISSGHSICQTKGETKIVEYADLHRDIEHLDADKLMNLVNLVLKQIWKDETKTYNTEEISLLLLRLINDEKLALESLDKNFRVGLASKVKKIKNRNIEIWDSLTPQVKEAFEKQWEFNKKKTNCRYEMECGRYRNKA